MPIRRRPTEQEIAQRAYELYVQRGHGTDEQARLDWMDAEAELQAQEAAAESSDGPEGLVETHHEAPPKR